MSDQFAAGCPLHKEALRAAGSPRGEAGAASPHRFAAGCPMRNEARCLDCACLLKKSVLLFFIFLKLLVWGKTKPPEGNPYGGELKNCVSAVVVIQYITDTPP